MKKINPDVFDIFLEDYSSNNSTPGYKDDIDMNEVSPGLIMGVILKGITTYLLVSNKYQKEHPEKWEIVGESIKKKYYLRLYNYLLLIDLTKKDTVSQCLSYGVTPVTEVLSYLLKAFEGWEYYENCAVVKQYIDCFILSNTEN